MSDLIEPYSVPRVGVGVIVLRDGKFLLGKRRNAHGEGEWALIGGKLDHGESIEDCARREIHEESGMEIANIRFTTLFNSVRYPPKHFLAIGVVADWVSGEAQVYPAEKISEWGWFDFDQLPAPMFLDSLTLIQNYRSGKLFSDL
ncbi:MAG: NUDIX domain-containing protein [Patescibacteria group bacterium]|jgi:8-oxo-dGTP diphosphatase